MIILDTNVLSELMRSKPEPAVMSWVGREPPEGLCTTSIPKAEILFGIAAMPLGRRRTLLGAAAEAMFRQQWERRILPFDAAAAERYAEIVAERRRAGRPIEILDAQIAAIALAASAPVATRNVADFAGCGIEVINPWVAG